MRTQQSHNVRFLAAFMRLLQKYKKALTHNHYFMENSQLSTFLTKIALLS